MVVVSWLEPAVTCKITFIVIRSGCPGLCPGVPKMCPPGTKSHSSRVEHLYGDVAHRFCRRMYGYYTLALVQDRCVRGQSKVPMTLFYVTQFGQCPCGRVDRRQSLLAHPAQVPLVMTWLL
jgi:hypothetical protein